MEVEVEVEAGIEVEVEVVTEEEVGIEVVVTVVAAERDVTVVGTGVNAGFRNFIALDCNDSLGVISTASSTGFTVDPAFFLGVTECISSSIVISSSTFCFCLVIS